MQQLELIDDDAFFNWLAGFVDGEGCFCVVSEKDPAKKGVRCYFRIAVRSDDARILREAKRRTGLGKVTLLQRREPYYRQISWNIMKKAECAELVRLFERYPLRAKKARDFDVWRRAVAEWSNYRKGQRDADWSPMEALRDEMYRVREFVAVEGEDDLAGVPAVFPSFIAARKQTTVKEAM